MKVDVARALGGPLSTATLLKRRRREDGRLFGGLLVVVLALMPLVTAAGAAVGFGTIIAALAALALVAAIAWRPIIGLYLTLACVVLIEQEPLQTPIFTDRLDVFHWPVALAGLPERPIGMLLIWTLFVVVFRCLATRQPLRVGVLFWPLALLMACVAWGVAQGVLVGGDVKIIVLELRPFEYLFLAYLLACNLVSTKRHLTAFFWIVIAGAGVKALQGVYIVFGPLHGQIADQNEIMAHEESFFFVALLLLVVLFALHERHRAQLYTALAILPPLLLSLVANNRRADYVALLIGIVIAWVLVIAVNPRTRRKHLIAFALCGVFGLGYIAVFSHAGGALAEPARGIVATIHPDPSDTRDVASNLYRVYENYDLKYTARQSPLLGWGFGRPFLEPLVLPNILSLDPYYQYVPHNTVYWVMMR
ncbi:MAG TPA: hypothetical protein VFY89_01555, partial [Ktedonobacterales bacterium]